MTKTEIFSSRLNRAETVVSGIDIGFSTSDHHLYKEKVIVTATIRKDEHNVNTNTVDVQVNFELRDSSGFFDDAYNGSVDVLVIVDRI